MIRNILQEYMIRANEFYVCPVFGEEAIRERIGEITTMKKVVGVMITKSNGNEDAEALTSSKLLYALDGLEHDLRITLAQFANAQFHKDMAKEENEK